jgi:poly(3-hydroxybutyrate) depolymerase
MNRALAQPIRLYSEAVRNFYSHPWNPVSYTHLGRSVAATAELVERGTRHFRKPEFGLPSTSIDGEKVAITEEIVLRKPFGQLRRFKREKAGLDQPKLLMVAPMSGHYATLLRGTVEALLPYADIYITDWRDARMVPLSDGHFDLDDYIDYVIEFLEHLGPGAHAMAVCQPSVPVFAAVSLMGSAEHPCRPRSLTMMGGPIDTRVNPTVPNNLATTRSLKWFEKTVVQVVPPNYPGFMRRVYPGFLQLTGFMTMNLDRHVGAHLRLFDHLIQGDGDSAEAHRKFYDEYLAVMDMTAEFYLDTVKTVFQDHALPRGIMISRNRKVDPGAIRDTAILTVEGELDDISGIGQTRAAHNLAHNLPEEKHFHYEQPGVGHYGIFNGRRWREEIMPRVRDWIYAHA